MVIGPSNLCCAVKVGCGAPVLAVKVPMDGAVAWRASVGRPDGRWSGIVELGSGRNGDGSTTVVVDKEWSGSSKVVLAL